MCVERISNDYTENVRWFDDVLGVNRSCDVVSRDLRIGGRRGRIWVIDGFGGDAASTGTTSSPRCFWARASF